MSYFKTWHGFRLCAIDGTSIRLPDEANITNYFGVQKGNLENHRERTYVLMMAMDKIRLHALWLADLDP